MFVKGAPDEQIGSRYRCYYSQITSLSKVVKEILVFIYNNISQARFAKNIVMYDTSSKYVSFINNVHKHKIFLFPWHTTFRSDILLVMVFDLPVCSLPVIVVIVLAATLFLIDAVFTIHFYDCPPTVTNQIASPVLLPAYKSYLAVECYPMHCLSCICGFWHATSSSSQSRLLGPNQ